MPCPLPVAKRVVMEDEYKRILERSRLPEGQKNRVPAWLQRLGGKMICGESTMRWALRIHHSLLHHARLLGVGPQFETGPSKRRPCFYYDVTTVVEWCAANRVRINPPSEAPHYLQRRYGI